jgi:ABC-type multidrug transport system ATPase subunit
MGLCSQKDILYEELTVEEHLSFIARLKGMKG